MEGNSDPPSNVSLKQLRKKDETELLLRLNNNHFEHPAFDWGLFEEAENNLIEYFEFFYFSKNLSCGKIIIGQYNQDK